MIAKVPLVENLLRGGISLPPPSQAIPLVKPRSPGQAAAVAWKPARVLWENCGHSTLDSKSPGELTPAPPHPTLPHCPG